MNAVMESLLTRRSIRAFTEESIPRSVLMEITETGVYAPSGRCLQTWKFTIVSDRDKIQELARVIAAELDRDGYNMYNPAALIIPSNEAESSYGREDNACAMENVFLAAHSLGIGSVWINQLNNICDRPAIRAILTAWEIPDHHVVYGLAALGYPAAPVKQDVTKKGQIHMVE